MSIIIDIIIFAIIGLFFYGGYKKGFIVQVFQIVGLFAAFFLTTPISRKLTQITLDNVKQDVQLISLAISIIVYTIVYFFFYLLGKMFNKKADDSGISLPNKILGALFSSCKAVLVISLIVVVVRLFPSGEKLLQNQVGLASNNLNVEAKVDESAEFIDSGVDSDSLPEIPEGFKEEKNNRSQLLYLSYRTSQMLDPFVNDFKQFFYERKGEALKKIKIPDISLPEISLSGDDEDNPEEKDSVKTKGKSDAQMDALKQFVK